MDDQPVDSMHIFRILDANANRAAEGLRTLEEIARLVREDVWSSAQLKSLRHSLAQIVDRIPRHLRLQARSTVTDAGTNLTAASEQQRADWHAIITSASERIGQSLRCLEEFAKYVDHELADLFKRFRYQAYDVLAQVEQRLSIPNRLTNAHLYVLVDCQKPLDKFVDYVGKLIEFGVDVVQIRDKVVDDAQLVKYTQAAMTCIADKGAFIVVNDRADVALVAGASGVHVGQEDLPIEAVRRIVGYDLIVGVSTHSIEQAEDAQRRGADYIGVGPTFPTDTKQFVEFPGLDLIRQVSERIRIPAFAIGGISSKNLLNVIAAGARGIAVSSAIHSDSDPFVATRLLAQQMRLAGKVPQGNYSMLN